MMMLATSALSAAVVAPLTMTASMFSPSRNQCMKRVAPFRFRYDPYAACVIPAGFPLESPAKYFATAAVPAPAAAAAAAMTMYAPMSPSHSASNFHRASPAVETMPRKAAGGAPRFAVVRFKHESATYLAPFRISVGDVVVVEGDRGENIGSVLEISQAEPNYAVPAKVLRRATPKDLETLHAQRAREDAAIKTTQALANSLGLHAAIEDAEYQFDLNKLTIFVRRASKNAFVDFRKLQRGLFREFRCRIWCAYMDEVEAQDAAPRCR